MPATRNRTPRLAVLDSSVRRSASSPFTSRSGSPLKRRIVVVSLVVLSLALITASFRESSGGRLHGVQNTVDKDPCRLSAGYVAYPIAALKTRYKSPAEYAKRVAASAARLAERRLILPEDAEAIARAAQNVRWDD